MTRRRPRWTAALPLALACLVQAGVVAATLERGTAAAWDTYLAATAARINGELASPRGFFVTDFLPAPADPRRAVVEGRILVAEMGPTDAAKGTIAVTNGLISHWRGSVFLRGVTLDALLNRLQHPSEDGPHQEDVLALKVLQRDPDRLRLYIRMTRTKIVTVTYDTEHLVAYRRHGPSRASSTSVATRIVELDGAGTSHEHEKPPGQDRGFLWRLSSFWRYEQVPGGVIVELESLTLSRSIPLGLGVIVEPIINRVARESMTRTLENLRRTYAISGQPSAISYQLSAFSLQLTAFSSQRSAISPQPSLGPIHRPTGVGYDARLRSQPTTGSESF